MHWWTRACCGHMLKTTDLRKHVLYLHQLLLETFSVCRIYPNSLSVTFDIACQPATHTHTHTHSNPSRISYHNSYRDMHNLLLKHYLISRPHTPVAGPPPKCCSIFKGSQWWQLSGVLRNTYIFLPLAARRCMIPMYIICIPSYTHSYWPL